MDDLSFSEMSLLATPSAEGSSKHAYSSKYKLPSRPSFAPPGNSGRPSEANLRLLQGVAKPPPPPAAAKRAAAGGGKRRMSLFAPSALPSSNADADDAEEKADESLGDVFGRDDDGGPSGRGSRAGHADDEGAYRPREPSLPMSLSALRKGGASTSQGDANQQNQQQSPQSESREQIQRQLEELGRMNDTFEAYERMLEGTAGQIEVSRSRCLLCRTTRLLTNLISHAYASQQLFSVRLDSTSTLLSSYIDLLLRASEHQNLLLNPSWEGQTVDQEKHEEAMRQFEAELERRRREREEEEERRAAEKARIEREKEEAAEEARRRASTTASGAGRGTGLRGVRGRGGATASAAVRGRVASGTGAARGASTATTTTRGRVASATGRPPSAAATSRTGAGAGARPSGIPAPSSRIGTARGRGTSRT